MIYIQKFRANDLDNSKGKQIEFNIGVSRGFFRFTENNYELIFNCYSIVGLSSITKIKVALSLSEVRGDYKIYQNSDGSPDLKDYLLNTLNLTKVDNIDDYFAIKKIDNDKFDFCYIPSGTLFDIFYKWKSQDYIYHESKPEELKVDDSSLRQVIYYGAPGTGKSYHIKNIVDKGIKPIRTTFHPDSDYSTFVGAYKPTMKKQAGNMPNREYSINELAELLKVAYTSADKKLVAVESFAITYAEQLRGEYGTVSIADVVKKAGIPEGYQVSINDSVNLYHDFLKKELSNDERIVYEYVPQAFMRAYEQAWTNYPNPQYLVIEEINRGSCAQIFGDLFQLLDRNVDGFSEFPILADTDIQKHLVKVFEKVEIPAELNRYYSDEYDDIVPLIKSGEYLLLPSNLHIWATMNTSDQSLFPIDSAFKRRWDWVYIPIKDGALGWSIDADGMSWDWWTFLEAINKRIGAITDSEDKKLGYFFAKPQEGTIITAERFVSKVVFYLWNDVFKDYGFDDEIFLTIDNKPLTFPMFFELRNDSEKVNEEHVAHFIENVTKVKGLPIESIDEQVKDEEQIEEPAEV